MQVRSLSAGITSATAARPATSNEPGDNSRAETRPASADDAARGSSTVRRGPDGSRAETKLVALSDAARGSSTVRRGPDGSRAETKPSGSQSGSGLTPHKISPELEERLKASSKKILDAFVSRIRTYTVQEGDTLSSIAARYGVDVQQLYRLNKDVIGPNPDLIQPGMKLKIMLPARHADGAPSADTGAGGESGWGAGAAPADTQASGNGGGDGTATAEAPADGTAAPVDNSNLDSIFTTQVVDSVYNPEGPYASKDCGPASLLMSLRLAGVDVPYNARSDQDGDGTLSNEEQIVEMRYWMTGQGETGLTNSGQVIDAAGNHGYSATELASFDAIKQQAAEGKPVMVSGNTGAIPDGSEWGKGYDYVHNGGPGGERSTYYGNGGDAVGHFIMVTNYDAATDTFTVMDPMAHGPIQVPASQVEAFYNAGPSAVVIGS